MFLGSQPFCFAIFLFVPDCIFQIGSQSIIYFLLLMGTLGAVNKVQRRYKMESSDHFSQTPPPPSEMESVNLLKLR